MVKYSQSPSVIMKGTGPGPCLWAEHSTAWSEPGIGGTSPRSNGSCNLHASAAAQHSTCQKQVCSRKTKPVTLG